MRHKFVLLCLLPGQCWSDRGTQCYLGHTAPLRWRVCRLHPRDDEFERPICRRDVQEDLQAWHANQIAEGTPRRKGPLIDPFSHGGYQGQPAPEWRPYRPRPPPAPGAPTPSSATQAVCARQLAFFWRTMVFLKFALSGVEGYGDCFCISDLSALSALKSGAFAPCITNQTKPCCLISKLLAVWRDSKAACLGLQTSSAQQAHVQSQPIQQVRMPAAPQQPPNTRTPAPGRTLHSSASTQPRA